MIDLLYNWKKYNVNLENLFPKLIEYDRLLSEITGNSNFTEILTNYTHFSDINVLIESIKQKIIADKGNNSLSRGAVNVLANRSLGEISAYLCHILDESSVLNDELCDMFNYDSNDNDIFRNNKVVFLTYIMSYIYWFYSSCDKVYDCIIHNSSTSDLILVGEKTKKYLKTCRLDKNEKRFGSPCNREAYPLSCYNNNFVIGPPPMSTKTHKISTIEKVYSIFGYKKVDYIKIDKGYFARNVNTRAVGSYLPVSSYMSKSNMIKNHNDLLPCFLYDMFIYSYNLISTSKSFDIYDIYTRDFLLLDANYSPSEFFRNICYDENKALNLVDLFNLIY